MTKEEIQYWKTQVVHLQSVKSKLTQRQEMVDRELEEALEVLEEINGNGKQI